MRYSRLIYPMIKDNEEVVMPEVPPSFLHFALQDKTWNLYSSDEKNRTEYWECEDGEFSLEEVLIISGQSCINCSPKTVMGPNDPKYVIDVNVLP